MKTPDKVWLIDVGDGICWYDEPNPYGLDDVQKPDAVEYVRADSLARLIAEKQSEALEEFGDEWDWERQPTHKDLRHAATKRRRQAEEGDQ